MSLNDIYTWVSSWNEPEKGRLLYLPLVVVAWLLVAAVSVTLTTLIAERNLFSDQLPPAVTSDADASIARSTNGSSLQSRSLRAQEGVWRATAYSTTFIALQTFISLAGIGFIAYTVLVTSKTLRAANITADAAVATNSIEIRKASAYIHLTFHYHHHNDDPDKILITAAIQNLGDTAARDTRITLWLKMKEPGGDFSDGFMQSGPLGPFSFSGASAPNSAAELPIDTLNRLVGTGYTKAYVCCRLTYRTIFDNRLVTENTIRRFRAFSPKQFSLENISAMRDRGDSLNGTKITDHLLNRLADEANDVTLLSHYEFVDCTEDVRSAAFATLPVSGEEGGVMTTLVDTG